MPTTGDHSQFPPTQLEELLTGIGVAIDAVGGMAIERPDCQLVVHVMPTHYRRNS